MPYTARIDKDLDFSNPTQPNENFNFINSKTDFPAGSAGVITLLDNVTYFITTTLDLTGDRIICGQNTTILGGSSENCRIKSTGLNAATALITSQWSLPIRSITIEHDTAINLDASLNANQALDWFGVNFTNCATVGTVKGYSNFIASDCGLLNSGAITFDGTIATIGFVSSIFDAASTKTLIIIPATATITRRFRIIYSAFVALSGETALNVSTSATIPVEGYILDTVNFSGGGTYITGVQYNDNKSLFLNCKGVLNSAELAYYTMNGNVTATTVASAGVAYKVAGTTASQSVTQKFTNTANRATYNSVISRIFSIQAVLSLTSGNNHQIGCYFAKNGTIIANTEVYITTNGSGKAEAAKIQGLVELTENDYLEVFVENDTSATNITVTNLSVIVDSLN